MLAEESPTDLHKAGFVSIIGKPNAGKSTLMNELVGERLSIVSFKAQTTRHRILGIVNGKDFQIVYSDTPGIIKPKYALQASMMSFVSEALSDADIILWVTDITEKQDETEVLEKMQKMTTPIILIINKIDLVSADIIQAKIAYWQAQIKPVAIIPLSALKKINVAQVLDTIVAHLPYHSAYFPPDTLTDRPERFFASEIIRQKIFYLYEDEIPYCCEVVIEEFKEKENITVIRANILVERDSQKGILIGKNGEMLKKVGTQARMDLEKFLGIKVFLELYVKVVENWRERKDKLRHLGYEE